MKVHPIGAHTHFSNAFVAVPHASPTFMFLYGIYDGVSKSFRTELITKSTTNTRQEATRRVMATKLTRLTHKTAIQLHLVAESCTICSSCSRRPVRKLLDIPSYIPTAAKLTTILTVTTVPCYFDQWSQCWQILKTQAVEVTGHYILCTISYATINCWETW
jgi:hypothetical protein